MSSYSLSKMMAAAAEMLAKGDTGVEYIPSSIHTHNLVTGGHERKVVTVIGARPEVGKTGLAVAEASAAARAGYKVLLASTEDPSLRTAHKFLANELGPITSKLDVREVQGRERFVDFHPPAWADNIQYTEERRVWMISELIVSSGCDLAIVDYAQNLTSEVRDRMSAAHGDAVIRSLKDAAAKSKAAVVLMSQINREGGKRQDDAGESMPPTREDLKGSGSLEEVAKSIILLHRDKKQPTTTWWIWAKTSFAQVHDLPGLKHCKGGPYIKLHFDGARSKLAEVTP
jgi:replicative DNA helicase